MFCLVIHMNFISNKVLYWNAIFILFYFFYKFCVLSVLSKSSFFNVFVIFTLWQNTCQKQLEKERAYFDSQFREIVLCGREGMVSGVRSWWLHHTCSQEAGRREDWCSACFLVFIKFRTPAVAVARPTFRVSFSSQFHLFGRTPKRHLKVFHGAAEMMVQY